ncbi:MAG TPA: hypothetical protein VHG09_09000 [Longimicrobiales bacterium]|nr:hypothetical protein [Longimicrobiales bacterium]
MNDTIMIRGELTLAEVERVARGAGTVRVELDERARGRIEAANHYRVIHWAPR